MTTYTNLSFNDYISEDLTNLYNKYKAFYAFNEEQFKASYIKDTIYINDGYGLHIPKDNYLEFKKEFKNTFKNARREYFEMFGLARIAKYNFFNYESQISGDYEDAFKSTETYQKYSGLNKSEFKKEVYKIFDKCFEEAVEKDLF